MLKKMIEWTLRGYIQNQEIEKLTFGKVKMFRKQRRSFLLLKCTVLYIIDMLKENGLFDS
jgi:hypothetical protein